MVNPDPRSTGKWKQLRKEILAENEIENEGRCALCGRPGANSIDHVIPVKLGGAMWDRENLRPAHLRCNQRKGTRVARRMHNPQSREW